MTVEAVSEGKLVDLSIIVPIYNVEEYLIECLDSIDAQEGVDFEVILVDDGATDSSGDMAEEYARTHERFTCYHKENGGLSDARNYGIRRAKGEYICFLDSDDVIVPGIYKEMLAAARRDGSDVVSCHVGRMSSQQTKPSGLHAKAFDNTPTTTCLSESLQLLYDTTSWNKLYRREFFLQSGLEFPKGLLYEDIPVIIPLYCLAKKVSLVPRIGYLWRIREGSNLSITQRNSEEKNLTDRLEVLGMVRDFFDKTNQPEAVRHAWQVKTLVIDIITFVNEMPAMSDDEAELFFDLLGSYVRDAIDRSALDEIPVINREKIVCVLNHDLDGLRAVIDYQQGGYYTTPVDEREGRLVATWPQESPCHSAPRDVTREIIEGYRRVSLSSTAARAGSMDLIGAISWTRVNMAQGEQTYRAYIRNSLTGEQVAIKAVPNELGWIDRTMGTISDSIAHESRHYETGGYGFKLTIDEDVISAISGEESGIWSVFVVYENRFGSKVVSLGNPIGLALGHDGNTAIVAGRRVVLNYSKAGELQLRFEPFGNVVTDIKNVGGHPLLKTEHDCDRLYLKPVGDRRGETLGTVDLRLKDDGAFEVPTERLSTSVTYQLESDGPNGSLPVIRSARQANFYKLNDGVLRVLSLQSWLINMTRIKGFITLISEFSSEDGQVTISTKVTGSTPTDCVYDRAELCLYDEMNSSYQVLAVSSCKGMKCTFHIDFTSNETTKDLYWGARTFVVRYGSQKKRNVHAESILYENKRVSARFDSEWRGIQVYRENADASLALKSSYRWPAGFGSVSQREETAAKLYEQYRTEPINDKLIVFESTWGRKYNCNPRALYEYIDKHYPEYECVWSLVDECTPIEGRGRRVRRLSPEYFHCLATAKYLVNNFNFHEHYIKREGQIEIQTMHGTPLKTLGLEVPSELPTPGEVEKFLRKTARYDYLVVQGQFMESKAYDIYAFEKQFLRTGYPRTDALQSVTKRQVLELKRRMGLPMDKKILLYAPTWRIADHFDLKLDLDLFKKRLGDEWAVVIRIHHLAAQDYHFETDGNTVIDMTNYGSIEDLYLVSDAMMTDYSSAMFDYALVDKPILFYLYDFEEYSEKLRGMYFDIRTEAPGPLLYTSEEVVAALEDIKATERRYAAQRDQFMQKYLTYECNNSSEKIVQEVLKPKKTHGHLLSKLLKRR